jgi:hypothetical protein
MAKLATTCHKVHEVSDNDMKVLVVTIGVLSALYINLPIFPVSMGFYVQKCNKNKAQISTVTPREKAVKCQQLGCLSYVRNAIRCGNPDKAGKRVRRIQ